MMYDVIIVGAGIAGCVAARQMAEKGIITVFNLIEHSELVLPCSTSQSLMIISGA